MAELFATVAIVSSIVQLVDFGSKLVSRLNEFQANAKDTPKAFRQIKTEIPLLLDVLSKTKDAIDAGLVRDETVRVLLPVVDGCKEQIAALDTILVKILPAKGDSRTTKSFKALSSSLFQDDKVDGISSSVHKYVHLLTCYYAAASSTFKPMTDETLIRIRSWLSAPDPSLNYQKALKQRLQDTGLWFLGGKQYTSWKIDFASFLWLHGIPGCGKTILSSAIVQDILQDCCADPTKVLGYYYFAFNDSQKQTAESMVKSLITQLSQSCIEIPAALKSLFSLCLHGQRQPSLDALLDVLRQMIQDFPTSFIVLDALDECTDREELLPILETIAGWQLESLHVIVTSRNEADIRASMDCHVVQDDMVCLQSKVVDRDISSYVLHRLSTDKDLQRWRKNPKAQREIETVLMEKACGMWRWAACQLDTLGKCLNRSMLYKALRNLPLTLDETYERILLAVNKEYYGYAFCILQWLAFSVVPLKMEEVTEIVAITRGDTPMFDKDQVLEDPSDVLRICSSLVTIVTRAPDDHFSRDDNDEHMRPFHENVSGLEEITTTKANQQYLVLAHYSVKEYLVSERIGGSRAANFAIQENAAHGYIAESCLVYLLQLQEQYCLNDNTFGTYKLARYAAQFWTDHAHMTAAVEQDASLLCQLIRELFTSTNSTYINWLRIWDPDYPPSGPDLDKTLDSVPGQLYYASLLGLINIVQLLIDDACVDLNTQRGYLGNALHAASWNGHEKVVKRLIEARADVNAQGGFCGTALQAASLEGRTRVVEQLIEAGADVNAQGGRYGNALQAASFAGRTRVVEQLIEAGADVNAQGENVRSSALQAASDEGKEKVVELLLKAGADVNAQSGNAYGSALQVASNRGHEQVVKLLLKAGVDVDAQSGNVHGRALQAASRRGHEQVVKLLLRAGADVNAQSREKYHNALQAASIHGHERMVELLLKAGADINVQSGVFGTALHTASRYGYREVVDVLLKAGANVNAQGGEEYDNELREALIHDHKDVVGLLLKAGADINAQDGVSGTALYLALRKGHREVVELLVKAGAYTTGAESTTDT